MAKRPPLDPALIVATTSNGSTRCRARNKRGTQCGRSAIVGGLVCQTHGGSAPQVRRAAAERARTRLAEFVLPSIETLAKELKADKSVDRQRAANSILDRAGFARGHDEDQEKVRELLLERLIAAKTQMDTDPVLELVALTDDDDTS